MLINKITEGYVVQVFDTEQNDFVEQRFVAGDQVSHEDDEGNNISSSLVTKYQPFDMVQPVPQYSTNCIELDDGGCIEPPDNDDNGGYEGGGAIRRRDKDGNCEEIRYPGNDGYDEWLKLFRI